MKLKSLFIVLLGTIKLAGQDNLHYSQFYNAPMMTNPALCGQIGDDFFRLNAHRREQWSGLQLDNAGGEGSFAYSTMSGGIDLSLADKKIGVGLYALIDKAGGGIFNTMQFMPTVSYSFSMGDNALTFGVQPMFTMGQIDSKSLVYQTQPEAYNQNVSMTDMNAGVNYKMDLYYIIANFGFSVTHLLTPTQKFLKAGGGEKLAMYYRGYSTFEWELTDKLKLMPGAYFGMQGITKDILLGSNMSYKYMEMGTIGNRLILGLWARSNGDNIQSIIPKFGVQMNKLQILASYDYDISLSQAGTSEYFNKIPNTFEISIIFTGKPKVVPPLFEDDFILNPRY